MRKKVLPLLLAFACLVFSAGCRDYMEIQNMLIVAGIGLDLNEESGLYRSTVEIVNIGSAGGENIEAEIVEGGGETVYIAVQNAMAVAGGAMFGNHCKVVVIGDSLARRGINDIVDMVLRSPDFRKTVDVFVAEGSTAKKIMTQKTVKNDIVSYELGKILRSNYRNLNNTVSPGMYELHEMFISDCPSAVVSAVSIKKNNGEDVLVADGGALFSGDRLKGFLSGEQCRIYNMLTRDVKRGYLLAEDAALSSSPVGARIMHSRAGYTPNVSGDTLAMTLNIRADVVLDSSADLSVALSDKPSVEKLQKCFEAQLAADAESLIKTIQSEYGVDIFGFHGEFENCYRNEWRNLSADWPLYFRELQIRVVPDVRIKGSGLIENYTPNQNLAPHGNALP